MKIFCVSLLSCVLLTSLHSKAQNPAMVIDSKFTLVDLYSNETIDIYYDTVSWRTVNKLTNSPVDYYIIRYPNSIQADTVHGVTGLIVNNLIVNTDGKWTFNDAKVKWDGNELQMKDKYGRKVKWEKGVLKIKDWNSKYKSDGSEAKYKEDWDKIKWKENEMKIEEGTKKTKIQNQ